MYTQKQIGMIDKAVNQFLLSTNRKVDLRKFRDNQVKFWMVEVSGIAKYTESGTMIYTESHSLSSELVSYLPTEYIWFVMEKAIDETPSYSICNHKAWNDLGIDTDKYAYQEYSNLESKQHEHWLKTWVLEQLQTAGYIKVRMAGSLWTITKETKQ